ncbi:MAG: Cobalamin biosynthesis protein CobD [Syntrophus sp. SKADARSKE-3]|nr:Cobalamin biosynthesis protein CobD [Syntrophus sp. SKADARSKE-3]
MRLEYQILIAAVLDLLIGDPRWLPHPVKWIGRFAQFMERPTRRILPARTAGIVTALSVILGTAFATGGLIFLASMLHPFAADAVSICLLYTTFAARDLADHSGNVLRTLREGDLPQARRYVSWMVGRDTESLEEKEIVRATVESVAENSVDGVIAPIFWAVIGGPIGAMAYKAVNTLDSTFGYRNERYIDFGRASAHIDDAANFIPARLAVPLITGAAFCLGMRGNEAWRIARRDGRNHASPNSGWSEAAFAGALGIRLGGPVCRKGKPETLPFLGEPCKELTADCIGQANNLMFVAAALSIMAFITIRWLIERML